MKRIIYWILMLSILASIPIFLCDPNGYVEGVGGKISISAAFLLAAMSVAEDLWPQLRS